MIERIRNVRIGRKTRVGTAWRLAVRPLRFAAVMLALGSVFMVAGCRAPAPDADRSDPYRPTMPDFLDQRMEPAAVAGERPSPPTIPPPTAPPAAETPVFPGIDEVTHAPARVRVLQPGDRLEVYLHGIPQPKELMVVVDEGGYITMPHIGQVNVSGKTGSEVERLIERRYIDEQYYRSITCVVIPPHVQFFVRGEVNQPGRFPLSRDVTLLQAIAMAGGYTDHASDRRITILRGSRSIEVNARNIERGRETSPPIKPGDIIVVPRRRL